MMPFGQSDHLKTSHDGDKNSSPHFEFHKRGMSSGIAELDLAQVVSFIVM
jgi:hypothetical protein